MGAIKNVGKNAVAEMVREREENGPYKGFINFCERVNLKVINSRVFESLIKVGAFDSCEKLNRKTLLENLEMILAYCKKRQEETTLGLVSLFDLEDSIDQTAETNLDIQIASEFDNLEMLAHEAELMGIYISGHPLDRYSSLMKEMSSMPIVQVQDFLGSDQKENDDTCWSNNCKKSYFNQKR